MIGFFPMDGSTLENQYPGVGRLNYFLMRVGLMLAAIFAVLYFGPESRVFGIVTLAATIAGVVLDVMRLRNIGVSQWLLFLRFVPYAGLLLSIYMQSAQNGWIVTKRFDRTGWTILAAHAVLAAFIIYLLFRSPNMQIFGISSALF